MGIPEEKGLDRRFYDGLASEEKIDILLSKQEFILTSFPHGIEHHKQYHIDMEERRKELENLIRDIKRTIFKHGVMTLLLLFLSLTMLGLVTKFNSHIQELMVRVLITESRSK